MRIYFRVKISHVFNMKRKLALREENIQNRRIHDDYDVDEYIQLNEAESN